jgi:cytochrome c oxidase assembly protein subunit 15
MLGHKKYIRYTWFIMGMVLLVILAGGVVRMTQSGMGCPDWPKCFGRWVPPTNASQLPANFEKYLKAQDIDHTFNVYHTWIEYINRLLGAILGIFIIIHFVWSFRQFKKINKAIVSLSFFLLIAVIFQGWLGKKVVDANLATVKVTIHMLVALLIAAIPLLIIYFLRDQAKTENRFLKYLSTALLFILLIQIVLGTQVRQQIDEISKSLGYSQRELWIQQLDAVFIIHRSLSWLVMIGAVLLFWKARPFPMLKNNMHYILACVFAAVMLGVVMTYFAVPALAQPLHLLVASILGLSVFALRLKLK